MLRLVGIVRPRAVLIENVPGILEEPFRGFITSIDCEFSELGYRMYRPETLYASRFGVPQLRPRVIIVAFRDDAVSSFQWPDGQGETPLTVGETLYGPMASNRWPGAEAWKGRANTIAPTIVGGSKKHGGADLGPTGAKRAWSAIGVDGMGIADEAPNQDFDPDGSPKLTVPMVAQLQGFPGDWILEGGKTAAYRQVGNAFPPPVAQAVGQQVYKCLCA